jgi:hypothetical protein
MYLISYRGNILGVDEQKENKPYQVTEVIRMGFHCWIDVWWHEEQFWLGTHKPKYPVKPSFINMFSLWSNAMNFETLLKLKEYKSPHCFYYNQEPLLTDGGHIITDQLIEGYESDTLMITEDYIYKDLPLKGIISENILSFKEIE